MVYVGGMDLQEQLKAAELFIGALTKVAGSKEVPYNLKVFTKVLLDLPDNTFSKRFVIYNTLSGKSCLEFQGAIGLAQIAGMVDRIRGILVLKIGPKRISELENKEDFEDTLEVASKYLELAT